MPAYANIIWNLSDAVHSIWPLCNLLSSYQDKDVWRTLSNISERAFCKKDNAWVQVWNQKFFKQRVGVAELVTLINISIKRKKKRPCSKELTIWWTQSEPFFPKSGHYVVARLWTCLSILETSWLFWLCQGSNILDIPHTTHTSDPIQLRTDKMTDERCSVSDVFRKIFFDAIKVFRKD